MTNPATIFLEPWCYKCFPQHQFHNDREWGVVDQWGQEICGKCKATLEAGEYVLRPDRQALALEAALKKIEELEGQPEEKTG